MNLLTSYDWLKEYVDLGAMKPEEFAARVSLSGPGVERLHPQGKEWNKIVLGHVLEVKPHPNADKLRLAITDIGGRKATIVCGGSNLAAGQWVAVALEGSMVRWHGEGEPVELKPAEIRGVKSEGMICAANEIGLYDAFPHQEREILDIGKALPGLKMKAGTPIADVIGLSDDTVMDIEVTTNRVDAFSMVGMAREASAILNKKLTWVPTKLPKTGKKLNVTVQDKKLCPRYMAVKIDGVKVGISPWWLKRRLISAGLRPINMLVDITNFVMLELGQPMHAFDANKLAGGKIVVRKAKSSEKIAALDGKTYLLHDSMLVIADAERPQAVAGVMGSETSAVSGGTTSVIFEAAAFNEVSVRRTARSLNLYSDSQLRFEKGLSVEAPADALARAVELCLELCGGTVSGLADIRAGKYKPASYSISFAKINELIGVSLKPKDCVSILKRLGFKVLASKFKLLASTPWWRDHDIEDGRDLVEEIARVYGYGNLPAVFPAGISSVPPSMELRLEDRVRAVAKAAGFTETITYSFTSREVQSKAGYEANAMLRLANPLTADFEFMRTSLLPSLLQVVSENQDRYRSQKLFELQRVYYPKKGSLPDEQAELGVAILGGDEAWREAKGLVEGILSELAIEGVTWKRLEDDPFWHPGRSAQAWHDGRLLASFGELHPNLAQGYKLEGRVALVDMPMQELVKSARKSRTYIPVSTFPQPMRDLALIVARNVEAQDVTRVLREADPLVRNVEWFDTYAGKGIEAGKKSLALHVTLGSDERTLETAEVDAAIERVTEKARKEFKATIRI